MFSITRITNTDEKLYTLIDNLYASAFPYHEKREERAKHAALANPAYHLEAWQFDNTFVGFIGYWMFKHYAYIEHLAIEPSVRSRGFGKQILERFLATHPQTVLEIDPLTTDIAHRRLRFYQSLGFIQNDFAHHHPSYHAEMSDHKLIVLSSKQALSDEQYTTFCHDLRFVVMGAV